MKQVLNILHAIRKDSYLNMDAQCRIQNIVAGILKAFMCQEYDISRLSPKLNLKDSELVNILNHAGIEIEDNHVREDGIEYLVNREVGKIKRYFELSLANYALLSTKEQRIFNSFLKRYGIKYRKIRSWKDLKIETIRNDCYNELTQDSGLIFYDGKYVDCEEIEAIDNTKYRSMIQLIRSSLMYNVKNMRKWIQFKPIYNSTIVYILMHHFHIFTSDDNNSIHAAKQISMFNLSQNAKNYILAA